jgi:hypothetical protein
VLVAGRVDAVMVARRARVWDLVLMLDGLERLSLSCLLVLGRRSAIQRCSDERLGTLTAESSTRDGLGVERALGGKKGWRRSRIGRARSVVFDHLRRRSKQSSALHLGFSLVLEGERTVVESGERARLTWSYRPRTCRSSRSFSLICAASWLIRLFAWSSSFCIPAHQPTNGTGRELTLVLELCH